MPSDAAYNKEHKVTTMVRYVGWIGEMVQAVFESDKAKWHMVQTGAKFEPTV